MIQPYWNRTEIEPLEEETVLLSPEKKLIGAGKVLVPGKNSDSSVGDILYFRMYGMDEIVEPNGTKHYFIEESPEFIIAIDHAAE